MANVKDFTKKTAIADNDAVVLVDQTTNAGSIMGLNTLQSAIFDGFRAYTLKGNSYVSINLSGSTESVPSGAIFFGYHHVALASWASASAFSRVDTIVTPSGNEVLTLDGGRIYTGTDANRRLTVLVPKQVALTIETASTAKSATLNNEEVKSSFEQVGEMEEKLTDVNAEVMGTELKEETV